MPATQGSQKSCRWQRVARCKDILDGASFLSLEGRSKKVSSLSHCSD